MYLFGIDFMLRLIIERKLKKIMRYFCEELDVYVLKGYIKVVDNFFFNLFLVFIGLKVYIKEVFFGIDNILFIWKNFFWKGYIDYLLEDYFGFVLF